MNSEHNAQCPECREPLNRRDFTRNYAKYGLASAIGLFLGIRQLTKGEAHTNCQFRNQETRYSPTCPTHQSCWYYVSCPDGHWYWYRAYCGACTFWPGAPAQ